MSVQAPGTRWYNAVWRGHFYAGLFCISYVAWLALTGTICLWRPQLEALLAKHALVDLIMTAQEGTALAQVVAPRPGRFPRFDRQPGEPTRFDDVDARTTELILALAEQAYADVASERRDDLRRFLAHEPRR